MPAPDQFSRIADRVDRLTGAEAEEMRKRFLREAQIMKRLGKDSTHIVGLSTYEEEIESSTRIPPGNSRGPTKPISGTFCQHNATTETWSPNPHVPPPFVNWLCLRTATPRNGVCTRG